MSGAGIIAVGHDFEPALGDQLVADGRTDQTNGQTRQRVLMMLSHAQANSCPDQGQQAFVRMHLDKKIPEESDCHGKNEGHSLENAPGHKQENKPEQGLGQLPKEKLGHKPEHDPEDIGFTKFFLASIEALIKVMKVILR